MPEILNNRVATQADVDAGRVVFFIPDFRSKPYSFGRELPIWAVITKPDDEGDFPKPGTFVQIVQAEQVDGDDVLVGFLNGIEEGICSLDDIEIVDHTLDQLVAITGPAHVRAGEQITVSPANTQQVSEILRYTNQNGLTVTPTGGNTKQSWGNPVAANIRLDLTRLNKVLEHPWQDLTCTVQAGCTWQHLQETLAQHGQFVALDPLFADRATVGGILATNDSGALRHKYGSLRDLVIGMTLVLADGTIARSGGKVVKNVAGYDLPKLMTGSLGTLAVITEATFRLHSLPQHAQTFTVSAPQAQQLASLMANIRASHLLTQALQLRGDTNGFHLDIQLNAHPEARQADILQKMTQATDLKLEISSEEVWTARANLFSLNEKNLLLKITVPPEGVPQIAHDFSYPGESIVIQSFGIGYASVTPAGDLDATFKQLEVLSVSADCGGGSLLLLGAPNGYIRELQHRHEKHNGIVSPAVHLLMQAVKHQFDPNRILNPGRLLGGI